LKQISVTSFRCQAASLLSLFLLITGSVAGCSNGDAGGNLAVAKDAGKTASAVLKPVTTASCPPPALPNRSTVIRKGAPAEIAAPKIKYNAGEDPEYAHRCGWPPKAPQQLPGAILPGKRIVAYYGNPQSKRMGALGEYPKD